MALTTLDPCTALIAVDFQKGFVDAPFIHPWSAVLAEAQRLLQAFRRHGLPVVLVNVAGGAPGRTERPHAATPRAADWTELVPELQAQPGDIVVTKRTWGAFASTDLEQRLKALGVTQVVLAGVSTGSGVEATARQAFEAGFHVTLAVDAMTDLRAVAHEYSLAHVFPRLGESGTAQAVIDLLSIRSA